MKKIILVIWISLIVGNISYGQSLEHYVNKALQNNMLLRAKQQRIEQSKQDAKASGIPTDPMLQGGYYISPVSTKAGDMQGQIGVEQQLSWLGTYKAEKSLYQSKVQIQQKSYDQLERTITYQTQIAYFQVKRLNIEKQLYHLEQSNYQKQKEWLTQRLSTAKASQLDILRLQLQIDELSTKIEITQNSIVAQTAVLNRWVHGTDNLEVATDSIWRSITLTQQEIISNPTIQTMDAQAQSLRLQQKWITKNRMPKIRLGLNYTFITPYDNTAMSDNGQDAIMVKLGISLPVFSSKKAKAEHLSVHAQQESLEMRKLDQTRNLRSQWTETSKMLQNKQAQISLLHKQLDTTAKALVLIETAYYAGESTYLEFLRLEEQQLNLRITLAKSQADAHVLYAKLTLLK
ncbi:TolC family protein [Halosquirtibacter laminarini]|uniref:TolC family protein n=1 Tax=Halosquirtibacter laminarini TaxID=3374600 RepID=A0AC61NJB3_9BACT|nr:TolC family protein [Prolixibacteraceae bacterium]